MQKITPCLWFNFNAEEAVNHYLSIFKHSRILETLHYDDNTPALKGQVLVITFELQGQRFQALNGGPQFPFTEAISLSVNCETQDEVDALWDKLIAGGGSPGDCSWLKDKFGVSWQIVPNRLVELLHSSNKAGAARVMQAMMQMAKIDIAALEKAYAG